MKTKKNTHTATMHKNFKNYTIKNNTNIKMKWIKN